MFKRIFSFIIMFAFIFTQCSIVFATQNLRQGQAAGDGAKSAASGIELAMTGEALAASAGRREIEKSSSIAQLLNEFRWQMMHGTDEAAKAVLARAIDRYPDEPNFQLALKSIENPQEAIALAQELIMQNPKNYFAREILRSLRREYNAVQAEAESATATFPYGPAEPRFGPGPGELPLPSPGPKIVKADEVVRVPFHGDDPPQDIGPIDRPFDERDEAPAAGVAAAVGEIKRVLVVDDATDALLNIRSILLEAMPETELVFASSLEKAMQKYDEADFDLVITDLEMHYMDAGLQLARYIQGRCPVILTSSYSKGMLVQRGISDKTLKECGITRYVNKLDIFSELIPAIEEIANAPVKPSEAVEQAV